MTWEAGLHHGGSDDRGLMYAELNVADRIGLSDDANKETRYVVVRLVRKGYIRLLLHGI